MAIELSNFTFQDIEEAHLPLDISIHAPANEEGVMVIGWPKDKAAPMYPELAVQIYESEVTVKRTDSRGVQLVDLHTSSTTRVTANMFEEPLPHVHYTFDDTRGLWVFSESGKVTNPSLFKMFSAKVCSEAIIKYRKNRALRTDIL